MTNKINNSPDKINNPPLRDKEKTAEANVGEPFKPGEGIYIGLPRRAFGLIDFSFFNEKFLSQCPCYITIGKYKGEPYSKDLAEDEASLYVTFTADSFNDAVNPLSGIIKAVGMMKYEIYAKFGYMPDRYDHFLEFAKLLNNNYPIAVGDREKIERALFCLRKEHIFDLSHSNKKAVLIYLHHKGCEFKEDVPGLLQQEYYRIIEEC